MITNLFQVIGIIFNYVVYILFGGLAVFLVGFHIYEAITDRKRL